MARSNREKRLEWLRQRVKGMVTACDLNDPDFDGTCSVPTRLARKLVRAESDAALLACRVHDVRAMRIRGWCRKGMKPQKFRDPAHIFYGEGYMAYTKPWRRDVKRANREFFKNLWVGLGIIYAVVYYLGVANKVGRESFTPKKGPLAEAERMAKIARTGIESDG